MCADDGFHKGASPFRRNAPAMVSQFRLGESVNQIALAKRRPIQSIRFIQENFIRLWVTTSALRTASHDINLRFVGGA